MPKREEIGNALAQLRTREAALSPFKSLGPKQSEQALKRLQSTGGIELRRTFDKLSKETGRDYAQAVKDLQTRRAFEVGAGQGSKNVNLFSALFGGGSAALGADPMTIGALTSLGAGAGATVDRFGPKITKKILDSYLDNMAPLVEKISNALTKNPGAFGKYSGLLKQSLGNNRAMATTIYLLKNDPEFVRRVAVIDDDGLDPNLAPHVDRKINEEDAKQMFIEGN